MFWRVPLTRDTAYSPRKRRYPLFQYHTVLYYIHTWTGESTLEQDIVTRTSYLRVVECALRATHSDRFCGGHWSQKQILRTPTVQQKIEDGYEIIREEKRGETDDGHRR